jgi:hypothetical protein
MHAELLPQKFRHQYQPLKVILKMKGEKSEANSRNVEYIKYFCGSGRCPL